MAIATLPFVLPAQLGVTVAELTYFTITGFYGDIENPPGSGSSITPTFGVVSGTVTFFPRVPSGTTLFIPALDDQNGGAANTALALAPIQARIINGLLQTINRADSPNVQLIAFDSNISTAFTQQGLGTSLVYDVQFANIDYAGVSPQVINNFAFTAPTSATTISLTDPLLSRAPYEGPNVPFVLQ